MRTQVGIVGAGPAGLVLGHLLGRRGIDSIVIEARDREYVQQRVRAGVLEQGTVDLLVEAGVGGRLEREGLVHEGLELRFGGRGHRIALSELTEGRAITIYGQQEVVKDLIAVRLEARAPLYFEVDGVRVDAEQPRIEFSQDGSAHAIECDVVAGCDGFHGVTRGSVPEGVLTEHEHVYPFAWLG
ncbi:MAG TPA: FAD-dependent monooxygenase, partial [Thermoleophilaceae bacterium]